MKINDTTIKLTEDEVAEIKRFATEINYSGQKGSQNEKVSTNLVEIVEQLEQLRSIELIID